MPIKNQRNKKNYTPEEKENATDEAEYIIVCQVLDNEKNDASQKQKPTRKLKLLFYLIVDAQAPRE